MATATHRYDPDTGMARTSSSTGFRTSPRRRDLGEILRTNEVPGNVKRVDDAFTRLLGKSGGTDASGDDMKFLARTLLSNSEADKLPKARLKTHIELALTGDRNIRVVDSDSSRVEVAKAIVEAAQQLSRVEERARVLGIEID